MNLSIRNKLYLAFGTLIGLLVVISVVIFVTDGSLVRANKEVVEASQFESQAKTFQKQHADWINALANHVFVGTKFDKHLNPHECAFGEWYYSYVESEDFKHLRPEMHSDIRRNPRRGIEQALCGAIYRGKRVGGAV